MNIPNTLTLCRILFAIVIFYLINAKDYDFCLLVFILAALTDFLDGWWARKYKQITIFGRIMDPFADKFLICGVFICLLEIPEITSDAAGFSDFFMLQAWMVIVIVGRELLITSLRAVVESAGGDFSAKWIGKWKMVLQCIALIACFIYLAGGAERAISTSNGVQTTQELLVSDFYAPQAAASVDTGSVFAIACDFVFHTKYWRNAAFYTMILFFWLTTAITFVAGLDYTIFAIRAIRKQIEEGKLR